MVRHLPVNVIVVFPSYGQSSLPISSRPLTQMYLTRRSMSTSGLHTKRPVDVMLIENKSSEGSSIKTGFSITTWSPVEG